MEYIYSCTVVLNLYHLHSNQLLANTTGQQITYTSNVLQRYFDRCLQKFRFLWDLARLLFGYSSYVHHKYSTCGCLRIEMLAKKSPRPLTTIHLDCKVICLCNVTSTSLYISLLEAQHSSLILCWFQPFGQKQQRDNLNVRSSSDVSLRVWLQTQYWMDLVVDLDESVTSGSGPSLHVAETSPFI